MTFTWDHNPNVMQPLASGNREKHDKYSHPRLAA